MAWLRGAQNVYDRLKWLPESSMLQIFGVETEPACVERETNYVFHSKLYSRRIGQQHSDLKTQLCMKIKKNYFEFTQLRSEGNWETVAWRLLQHEIKMQQTYVRVFTCSHSHTHARAHGGRYVS